MPRRVWQPRLWLFSILFLPLLSGCHLWGLLTKPVPTVKPLEFPTQVVGPVIPTSSSTEPDIPQGKIVYTCQLFRDSKSNQICLMNADGSDQRRMTWEDETDHIFGSIAPDGQSILYAANSSGTYQVYEMDLAGNAHQITEVAGDALAPAVSPDGKSLVFTHRLDGRETIWIADRDGANPYAVEETDRGQGWDPVWSPDGEQILFASDRNGSTQLYIIHRDGSRLTQVTSMDGIRGRSDWSPDGTVLTTYIGTEWKREIYLMDRDGGNARAITSGGNNLAPSFSPDGKWITFTSYRDLYEDVFGCEIYIMRLADGAVTRLTDNDVCDWQPRWGR